MEGSRAAAAEQGGSRFGEVWWWKEAGVEGEMASGGGGSKKRYCGVADLGSKSKKRWDARAYRAWIGQSYRKFLEPGIITFFLALFTTSYDFCDFFGALTTKIMGKKHANCSFLFAIGCSLVEILFITCLVCVG